jgi:hypothetical protein
MPHLIEERIHEHHRPDRRIFSRRIVHPIICEQFNSSTATDGVWAVRNRKPSASESSDRTRHPIPKHCDAIQSD